MIRGDHMNAGGNDYRHHGHHGEHHRADGHQPYTGPTLNPLATSRFSAAEAVTA